MSAELDLDVQTIEQLIAEDKIVYASYRGGKGPPQFGKFIKKQIGDETLYSFASYKKGVDYPNLPAEQWIVHKKENSSVDLNQALAAARKKL